MSRLKAGAASIVVELGEGCFPNSESVMQHDDVYVRVVIFETDEKYAILEADMPSMFPSQVKHVKQRLADVAGVKSENSWIVVNHGLSAPHTWPLEAGEQKDTMRPKILDEDPAMMEAAKKINQAYYDAYEKAIAQANAALRPASVGYGAGSCGINCNRNMYTVDGWWEGVDHEGYSDHHLGVVRFNDENGDPIALLYNYSIRAEVMAGKFPDLDDGKVASSDVVGAASLYVENEYKGCTAIFMCGATGDQGPIVRLNYIKLDREGHYKRGSFGTAGFILNDILGQALGHCIMQVSEKIECLDEEPEIGTATLKYTLNCQKRDADMYRLKPMHSFTATPAGTRELKADAMRIGDIGFIGVMPELDALTVTEIREQSPFEKTVVTCFVNGNSKSTPRRESYERVERTAVNSPFVEGSAEITRDKALELLNLLK